jgi:hypothetical protein
MTIDEFEKKMNRHLLETEYAEYIMAHSNRIICNGDTLIEAMEDGELYEDFRDYMVA